MQTGIVYLVGGGPGDAKLITVKGREAIEKADVIVYDRLVNPKLLEYARQDCEIIYGGKLPKHPVMKQEQLNDLLVAKACEGKVVVRLKGGDPGVFGRVGEEAEKLQTAGIDYEIVPGITSGIAAPAYAGIPVTHREFGNSFAMVSAHGNNGRDQPAVDWESLKGIDTIAFYMGIANLPHICKNLIDQGKSPDTPVILIQWGTYTRQKSLQGTLSTIAERAAAEEFKNPAIILVGDIVDLRSKINWFERKPLFGRQILLARTANGESKLAEKLIEHGAEVISYPKWKSTPASIDSDLLHKLSSYDSVFFSSPESTACFFRVLVQSELDIRSIQANIHVQSEKSLKLLEDKGIKATISSLEELPVRGLLVVKEVVKGEKSISEDYDVFITNYKQMDEDYSSIFLQTLDTTIFDTVLFPSSASVDTLIKGLENSTVNPEKFLEDKWTSCLGEKTRKTLESKGFQVDLMPEKPTIASYINELQKLSTK
ncbi:uroporphyrinogen-III C-methyltransferase [Sediminibacillus massiliensis]|uniref:uroporphyrinogen-III C-methyltransferase n=1 Tax=Sediminibacillus massiliensis TaxID=1926277 RepID=UPI000988541F|nr:uroporphyrinogen-III C-methyltransferase [Sediminibacillus massiliensis]